MTGEVEFKAETVAIHEAGHVVAMVAARWKFRYVTIRSNDTAKGHVQLTLPALSPRRIRQRKSLARIYLAGPVAQSLFDNDDRPEILYAGANGDLEKCRRLYYADDLQALLPSVQRFVEQRASEIITLAGELVRRQTMTAREVREFLGRVEFEGNRKTLRASSSKLDWLNEELEERFMEEMADEETDAADDGEWVVAMSDVANNLRRYAGVFA